MTNYMETNTMKICGMIDWETIIKELNRLGISYVSSDPWLSGDNKIMHTVVFFSTDRGETCRRLTEMIGGDFVRTVNGVKVA